VVARGLVRPLPPTQDDQHAAAGPAWSAGTAVDAPAQLAS
jgi:hypothetical protein